MYENYNVWKQNKSQGLKGRIVYVPAKSLLPPSGELRSGSLRGGYKKARRKDVREEKETRPHIARVEKEFG